MTRPVANFGGNVRFTQRHVYRPRTEAEVLVALDRYARDKVRVVGAALVDLYSVFGNEFTARVLFGHGPQPGQLRTGG